MKRLLCLVLVSVGISLHAQSVDVAKARAQLATLQAAADALKATLGEGPSVVVVPATGKIQPFVDAAQPGDTLILAPGATYTGLVVLRKKSGAGTITITTAGPLPPGRMTPAAATSLAKITSGTTQQAITTEPGAHDYALVGLEVMAGAGLYPFGLVSIGAGDATQTTLDQVPTHFLIDRCYIHGDPTTGAKRGIDLNGADVAVTNNAILDIKGKGQDTQAIGGVNGPGPFVITNNQLEAAGENILFGGADPTIPNLIPSDIAITGNDITKPLAWRTQGWSVKNVVELKNAQRVVITGNTIEHSWTGGQTGFLLVLTVRDQSGGAPWSTLRDIDVHHNVFRHGNQGVNVLGLDDIKSAAGVLNVSVRAEHLHVHDNLFYDIGGSAWGGGSTRAIFVNNGPIDATFTHNTFVGAPSAGLGLSLGSSKTAAVGLVVRDNILPEGNYGITGDNTSIGAPSWIAAVDATSVYDYNQVVKGPSGSKIAYPGAHTTVGPMTFDAAFASAPAMVASDGLPVGADLAAIRAAIATLDLMK